jgi:DnaJ-class molecular chaperone
MSLYQTLGISKDATKDEIKKAYRKLSKTMHPDVGGDEESFDELKQAYDVLMDDNLRKLYDETGTIGKVVDRHNMFMSFISSKAVYALENFSDDPFFNLIDFLKGDLKDNIEKGRFTIIDVGTKKNTLQNKLKNIQNKKGGENLIAKVIELKVNEYSNHIEQIKSTIKDLEYCMDRINEYSYSSSSGLISWYAV